MRKNICFLLIITFCTLLFGGCTKAETTEPKATLNIATESTSQAATDTITVVDSELGKIKITPFKNLEPSEINTDYITNSNGTIKNYQYNNITSKFGIDISSYSGTINWEKVKNAGVEFAFIRIGGRGYGDTGNIYLDSKALENIKNAQENNIDTGVYFFSQAISEKEAIEEAYFVIENLQGIALQLPVVYDFEFIDDDVARTDNITGEEMTTFAKAFCNKIKSRGYDTMIYGESNDFYSKYNLSELADIPLWYAQYSDKPEFYYQYKIWQYSKEGVIDGIDGSVDLNLMFIKN